MRNMSFALTKQQYLDGSKDVTRRLGWEHLKAGEYFMGVEKGMGLKPGEKIVRIGASECLSLRREPLQRMIDEPEYGREECRREGFPDMTPVQFVEMFCRTHKRCTPTMAITRIEFKRVACTYCGRELDDEQAENPEKDKDGDVMCDECYREHFMDTCPRCCELFDKTDLDASPGNLVIVMEEAPATPDDLKPGYYRIKKWPFFVDYMIGGHFYGDAMDRVCDLDKPGERAAKEAGTAAAPLCSECRTEIEETVTESKQVAP